MSAIQAPLDAIAALVESVLDAIAAFVETVFDAIAASIQSLGAILVTIRRSAVGPIVEPLIDALATLIKSLVDSFATLIKAFVNAIAAISGQRWQGKYCQKGGCHNLFVHLHRSSPFEEFGVTGCYNEPERKGFTSLLANMRRGRTHNVQRGTRVLWS
jgi:hypothetical protein